MYLTYLDLIALYPKYSSAPYTPEIVQLLLDRSYAIINSHLCRSLDTEQITVTKEVMFDEIGCGMVLLPDCYIQSIDLVEISCDCTNVYSVLEPCDYRGSCEYGWIKFCQYGGCTNYIRVPDKQCCCRITYTKGINPLPTDFLQVYYALLNNIAHCTLAEYNESVGCTVSDDVQPISKRLASYSTEGESATFYQSEMDKACEDQGAFLVKNWMKEILDKYKCCNSSGIARL